MSDLKVFPAVLELFRASKNTTWRQQIWAERTAIYRFLKNNELILVDPFDEEGRARQDFVLMRSHLTDDGFEMFKKVIPSWRKARDRDGNLENTGILEKGLQKIRAARDA